MVCPCYLPERLCLCRYAGPAKAQGLALSLRCSNSIVRALPFIASLHLVFPQETLTELMHMGLLQTPTANVI